jgi:hypothetical protein
MHPARGIIMVLGLAIFIAGVYFLFFEAGLDRWISIGILTAGIVIFVGILLMGFAGGASEDRHTEVHDREIVREPRRETRTSGSGAAEERRYRD